ncbi:uncharacterized protein LOC120185319 [Hibiscus syriacus]|uniref:uncharacterized protein LOC120185319 n=1 Tax=Hibiscus syriacus TaxID=106335 RepID=UPI001922999A|nr:uncharacterized protein LOC120185319 [Hibiscus syriacus]
MQPGGRRYCLELDAVETMKAEMVMMRNEKKYMEALLTSVESAVEEHKRVVSMYKAMEKLADDLLPVVMEAEGDDNNCLELDEETMKELVEEAMRDFNEALKQAQSRRTSPADGGGDDGGSGDYKNTGDRTNTNTGNDTRGSGGGHDL